MSVLFLLHCQATDRNGWAASMYAALPDSGHWSSSCSLSDLNCMCTNVQLTTEVRACVAQNCSVKDTLRSTRLLYETCDYPYVDDNSVFPAVCIAGAVFSTIAVALRITARLLGSRLGLDDAVITVSLVTALTMSVIGLLRNYSNPLNTTLINHLHGLGNAPLKVRLGGSSQDLVYWIPDQEQGLLEASIEIARGAYRKLGPRLVGLEIGIERQDSAGTPGQFTANFLDAAYRIIQEVFGDRYKRIYTAGTLHAPMLIQCEDEEDTENCWSVRSLFENGINEKVQTPLRNPHPFHNPTISPEPHQHGVVRQQPRLPRRIHYRADILGETNSLFGHGRRNVSDTFAAALWIIDYTLYSAQTNITNLGFYQSWGWRYSAWRPIAAWGEPSGVLPAYYGFWLVHQVLGGINGRRRTSTSTSHRGGGGKKVKVLLEDFVSAYAIYDSESGSLSSVVALNLADWHSAGNEDERTNVTIQLENLRPRAGWKGEVYRLTAPGADVKDPEVISFAGQHVDGVEGTVHGRVDPETLGQDRRITLKASEGAVVMFGH
ncbi:hypothetical protein BJX62DRAFT_238944 [Aspergillus germanicus]